MAHRFTHLPLTKALRVRPRVMRVLGVALWGLLLGASRAQAQHRVTLRICPHVGDTLKMRYDQQVDMMGLREAPAGSDASARDSTVMRATTLTVLSRAIVEGSGPAGTDLVAVTDSVSVSTTEAGSVQSQDLAEQMLVGRQVHFRVNGDGATSITDSAGGSSELRAIFAQMPATLPGVAVAVGESWKRTMGVPMRPPLRPSGRQHGAPPVNLTATFRLDSLSHDENLAYISMQGTLERASDHDPPEAVRLSMTGNVTGSLIVDRRRGWLVDSHAVITVSSVVSPPLVAGGGASAASSTATKPPPPPPTSGITHVQMIVTQWLRTVN